MCEHDNALPPDWAGDADPLSLRVFQQLHAVMHLQKRLLLKTLSEKGVHLGQAACIRALAHHDAMSQRDLAHAMHISEPTLSRMLQRLEEAGMVMRSPDERDQRVTRVSLTDKARDEVHEIHAAYAEVVCASVGSLSEDGRRELERLLGDLGDGFKRALIERGALTEDEPDHVGGCETA